MLSGSGTQPLLGGMCSVDSKGEKIGIFPLWSCLQWSGSSCLSGICANSGSCTCSESLGSSVKDTFISSGVFSHGASFPHSSCAVLGNVGVSILPLDHGRAVIPTLSSRQNMPVLSPKYLFPGHSSSIRMRMLS